MEYLSIFVKGIFIENMIFAYFLGLSSYLAVSKTVISAYGLGLAVIFVLIKFCIERPNEFLASCCDVMGGTKPGGPR